MRVHRDFRTPTEVFDDMLADGHDLEAIAARLGWTYGQARARYLAVCARLGEKPDEN